MEYKKFGNKIVVRLDRGEEIVESIKKLCTENDIKLGRVSGIGAADKITVGLFHTETKKYMSKQLNGDHEITNLSGNISRMNDEVYLHLHITICDEDYNAFGGHLNSAYISGTGELIVDVLEGEVGREFDENIGLNLFKF
ncbi:MAG: DNA-binding protein [Clostridia bacterium]|nr:DNA-binding protein [Clostridia bacterium]